MPDRARAVNPGVLRWARERAGLSVAAVAARLVKPQQVIANWETGEDAPTFRQLEQLAERLYKRPLAIFFFPSPPDEEDPRTQFRTLPQAELDMLATDTRYALREALAFQDSVRELSGGKNPAATLITRDVRTTTDQTVEDLAGRLRSYLGVSIHDQSSWRNAEDAFKRWRDVVEGAGVLVFKRSFKQDDIFGFCLYDDAFPLIVVNNSTAHSRQVFTLFHEVAHLLYSVSGITKQDTRYLDRLSGPAHTTEVECNRLAAEFLVPGSTFPWKELGKSDLDAFVSSQARRYNVSREVILRRLLDRTLISQTTYAKKTEQWNREYIKSREGQSGGNYYATHATYLGQTYLRLAFKQYYLGNVSLEQLAGHLRVKARHVSRLEDFVVAGE